MTPCSDTVLQPFTEWLSLGRKQQKRGRGKVSSERRPVMEKEMDVLNALVMKDKSSLSSSLKNLDEGNLIFPRIELLPFLKEVDKNVREFTSDANLAKYPSRFITMCQTSVLNNETLEMDFKLLVASIITVEGVIDGEVVCGLFRALVSKLANTRINEFLNANVERPQSKWKSCWCGRDASTETEILLPGCQTQVDANWSCTGNYIGINFFELYLHATALSINCLHCTFFVLKVLKEGILGWNLSIVYVKVQVLYQWNNFFIVHII